MNKESFSFLIHTVSPLHVGFGKRMQVRDFRKLPIIPKIALETTVRTYARRIAEAAGHDTPQISTTDAYLIGEPESIKMLPITGSGTIKSEFVKGWFGFKVQCQSKDVPVLFATLFILEELGIGSNTSAGFGRVRFIVKEQSIPSRILKQITPILAHFFPREKHPDFSIPSAPMRFIVDNPRNYEEETLLQLLQFEKSRVIHIKDLFYEEKDPRKNQQQEKNPSFFPSPQSESCPW